MSRTNVTDHHAPTTMCDISPGMWQATTILPHHKHCALSSLKLKSAPGATFGLLVVQRTANMKDVGQCDVLFRISVRGLPKKKKGHEHPIPHPQSK